MAAIMESFIQNYIGVNLIVSIDASAELLSVKCNVEFFIPYPNKLHGDCWSVPAIQHQDLLEWKSPKLLPLCVKSA